MAIINYVVLLTVLVALLAMVQCRPGAEQLLEKTKSDGKVRIERAVDDTLKDKAFEYYKKLHTDHLCQIPQERIMSVQQIHPSNAVSYTTGSVVLHRCAEDTGCCAPGEVCVAKDTEKVEIPILMTKAGDGEIDAQMLSFIDHTSCHCVSQKTVAKA